MLELTLRLARPDDAIAYHQFMSAPVALVQYDKVDQEAEDAPIIWPRDIADVKYMYLKPGQ